MELKRGQRTIQRRPPTPEVELLVSTNDVENILFYKKNHASIDVKKYFEHLVAVISERGGGQHLQTRG